MIVAVLFARRDSIYKTLPDCDVYDIERDARTFAGGAPIVAHPPCRAWGQLRHMAKPRDDERDLSIWAIDQVRRWGGVLEHPRASRLWPELGLPMGEDRDAWGGFTLDVNQSWWGHKAQKRSLFYVCGCEPRYIPALPLSLAMPTHVLDSKNKTTARGRHLPKSQREVTPPLLAEWLVEVARRCSEQGRRVAA